MASTRHTHSALAPLANDTGGQGRQQLQQEEGSDATPPAPRDELVSLYACLCEGEGLPVALSPARTA